MIEHTFKWDLYDIYGRVYEQCYVDVTISIPDELITRLQDEQFDDDTWRLEKELKFISVSIPEDIKTYMHSIAGDQARIVREVEEHFKSNTCCMFDLVCENYPFKSEDE